MGLPDIAVSPEEWELIQGILERHVPGHDVWAFGSRARRNGKPYSDLDLAIIGDRPLDLATASALADEFSESDLPYKVDVVDWATTSQTFRGVIARDRVVIRGGGCRQASQP